MLTDPTPTLPPLIWRPDRAAALERLEGFLPNAGRRYAADRNSDLGPGDRSNVSGLSPWIRHRLLLEEEVLTATLRRHSFQSAQKFVQEVFWRTYFKGWLEQRPQVWHHYRSETDRLIDRLDRDSALHSRYVEAVSGRTGIDCFDAWVGELVETGYLHNHTRMWFAGIWIFTLELPWQLGADFFYRHLLDGDPASNTLGWRWVAGLHTKGKTYLARASNIARFTNGRFNPVGQLATAAPALSEGDIGTLIPLPAGDPVPADVRFGLLITEEDGHAESLSLPAGPAAALGLTATRARSSLPVSSAVTDFASGALGDALARAAAHYDIDAKTAAGDDWTSQLIDWARRHDLGLIVTSHAPLGPVSERLGTTEQALDAAGIRLVRVRRSYDSAAWPHAKKGFFALKAKIPSLLTQLGISS